MITVRLEVRVLPFAPLCSVTAVSSSGRKPDSQSDNTSSILVTATKGIMDIYELLNVLRGYEDGEVTLKAAIKAAKQWLKDVKQDDI